MNTLTNLETLYMLEVEREAFSGLIFAGDIEVQGISKAQKSGVVSSLVQKGILVAGEDGMIGPKAEGDDDWNIEANWEPRREDVKESVERYLAS